MLQLSEFIQGVPNISTSSLQLAKFLGQFIDGLTYLFVPATKLSNENYSYRSHIGRQFLPILSTIGLSGFHTTVLTLVIPDYNQSPLYPRTIYLQCHDLLLGIC